MKNLISKPKQTWPNSASLSENAWICFTKYLQNIYEENGYF